MPALRVASEAAKCASRAVTRAVLACECSGQTTHASGRFGTVVSSRRSQMMAWCEVCKVPFLAGAFGSGAGGMRLGLGGQGLYIGHMESFGDGTVALQGNKVTCPVCGTWGSIPDGLYDTVLGVVRESVRVFGDLTPDEALTLAEALRKRQQNQVNDEQVVAEAPKAAKRWIREQLKNNLIGILVAVLVAMYGHYDSASSARVIEQQVQQVNSREQQLTRLVQELIKSESAQPPATNVNAPRQKFRRNEPCWCDSGRKFKHCHGAASSEHPPKQ